MASTFLDADVVDSWPLAESQMTKLIDHAISVGSIYTEAEHLYWDQIYEKVPCYRDRLQLAGEDQIMLEDCTESLQALSGGELCPRVMSQMFVCHTEKSDAHRSPTLQR